ncbi:MAG: GNAT family N-acetyltransferase [Succinivibrio sp.]|nr:GNAT family N-acetyltransferase [Succinivibrio sp.]
MISSDKRAFQNQLEKAHTEAGGNSEDKEKPSLKEDPSPLNLNTRVTVTQTKKLPLIFRWADSTYDCYQIAKVELESAEYEERDDPLNYSVFQLQSVWSNRLKDGTHIAIMAIAGENMQESGDRDVVENPSDRTVDHASEKVLGMVGIECPAGDGYIQSLYVLPKYFGKGIGRRLMQLAADFVRSHGGRELKVEVQPRNYGAQKFYRALHFRESQVKLSNLILMKKELI